MGRYSGESQLNEAYLALLESDFYSILQVPKMEEFLGKRDYTGAMAVLEFNRHSGQGSEEVLTKGSLSW